MIRRTAGLLGITFILAATPIAAQTAALPDPKPEDAVPAILAAFRRYSIVAMLAGHGVKDVSDLILSLVRQHTFPNVVNDIVIECTNSKYQPILDRYIAGDDVRFDDVRQAWYNTQPGCADYHEALFPLIRRINQRLAPDRRLRVLAGEPPIDWSAVKTEAEVRDVLGSGARERSLATIVEREVLGKKRKALLLYGTTHLLHNFRGGGVNLYEQHYPAVTLVIDAVVGCTGRTADLTQELERRMSGWPVPSLAFIANTSLTTLDDRFSSPFGRWSQSVDAVLYLGPTALLLRQPMPAHLFLDSTSMSEMRRRATIPTAASDRAKDILDPAKILANEENPFLCG